MTIKNKKKIKINLNAGFIFNLISSSNPMKKALLIINIKLRSTIFKKKSIINNIYKELPPKHRIGFLWNDCGFKYSLSSKIVKFKFL